MIPMTTLKISSKSFQISLGKLINLNQGCHSNNLIGYGTYSSLNTVVSYCYLRLSSLRQQNLNETIDQTRIALSSTTLLMPMRNGSYDY